MVIMILTPILMFSIPPSKSLDTSWVSYYSAQFWHCLLGDSAKLQRLRVQSYKTATPSSLQRLFTSPGCHLCFWPLRGFHNPSLGSINLVKWLTEPRETFYLLDSWFVTKGCNSRTIGWKRHPLHNMLLF